MGAFDWLGQSLDWVKTRWNEDWSDFGKTFTQSWSAFPDHAPGIRDGFVGMMAAPFTNDADFWGAARYFADSVVGTGSALAGGTVGTLFQVPILHEAAWLLDKAYRYGVARPIATSFLMITNSAREAYMQGSTLHATLWENLGEWEEIRRAWNDSEHVTPGQALVYYGNMSIRSLDSVDASMAWAEKHDPRTPEGQATFNSPNAEFGLKYASGFVDFTSNIVADPGHGAAAATKFAKLRVVDKVADDRYILAGKVHQEVGTSPYQKVRALALQDDMTPERLRDVVMPHAVRGGEMATLLWTAARVSDDVYRDTYLTMRAFDVEAYKRLGESMPQIAADFGNMFANFTIADWDFQRGQLSNGTGADALRKAKTDAFVDAFNAGEGLWAQSLGIGVGEKMPQVRRLSGLRAGYHSFVLNTAPIILGRPLANLMPSQGWTQRINANDNTGYGLRQFRANLERSTGLLLRGQRGGVLTPKEIDEWTSRYGAATSDATRQAIAMQADDLVAGRLLKQYGLKDSDLPGVLGELNRWRNGQRRIFSNERLYLSHEATSRANAAAERGQRSDAQNLLDFSEEVRAAAERGEVSDAYAPMTDVDGHLNLVPLDPTLPVLRSQFAEYVTMLDYRALNGALRWHRLTNPKPKRLPDPDDADEAVIAGLKPWEVGLAKVAKARGFYDATIGALDSVSAIWKATALLRPAQAPRNVGSDTLLTLAEFGKMVLLLSAANIVPNAIRNFGPRGKLLWEWTNEALTRARGEGRTKASVDADVDVDVPGNVDTNPARKYLDLGGAFADRAMSMRDYLNGLEFLFEGRAPASGKLVDKRFARQHGFRAGAPYEPVRVGAPYFIERFWYGQWKDGLIDRLEYERAIVAEALRRNGRDKFRQKPWGLSLIKDLVEKHINRRDLPGYEDNPYAPGTVVVDPFTGLQPEVAMQNLRDKFDITSEAVFETRNVPKKKPGTVRSVALGDVHRQLVRWIYDNADGLLKPNTLVALRVKPDGNVSVGFATAKQEVVDSGETLVAGARQRLRNFRFDQIKDVGHTGFDVKVGGKVVASFEGWAEGAHGAALQRRISARDNPEFAFGALLDVNPDTLDEAAEMRPVRPRDPEYAESWERDVNAQIASDPVARMFLQRKPNGEYMTDSDVIAAVEDTPWGTKWVKAMSFRGVAYVDQIRQIEAMVKTYLPDPELVGDVKADAAHQLRQAVLEKKATYKQFEDLFTQDGVVDWRAMPEVHGLSVSHLMGNSRMWKAARQTVRKIQRVIADMPVDKWARFPFMSMAYQKHGTMLAKVANEYFKDADAIPADVVARIKDMAKEKAYHDVRYRLYDVSQRNDIASATRLLMPFSAAMMDSYIKYGRKIRENPMILAQGAYYWSMFERNEMVQDEEGHVAKLGPGGETTWYRVDPTTGERTVVPEEEVGKHRYVQFQLPSALARALGRKYYGVDALPVVAINRDTMNVFLNNPGGGPLVAFPANKFALSNPEFGEAWLTKKFLLPYGPSADWKKSVVPSTVRTAWDAFVAEDDNMAAGHAAAIMQAELIGYGLGTRNRPPTFEEVREKAASMRFLRFMATFTSPATFQLESPYQPYVDAFRQLLANPETRDTASEEFMRRHGDEFYAVSMSVTRNNAGLSATIESSKQYDKYKDLISRYPEFGGLIVGAEGAGAFAKSVYESQKGTPIGNGDNRTMRQLLSLEESVEDLQRKTVWAQYSKLMDLTRAAMVDRGLSTLRSRGAADLVAARDAFVEKYKRWVDPKSGKDGLSPWYLDYMSSDRGKVEHKFEALWEIARDERLQQRDDIRGLLEYLSLRQEMQAEMARHGVRSLGNQKAFRLAQQWDTRVHDLVESNGPFADLWNRWLSTDHQLDIPSVPVRG